MSRDIEEETRVWTPWCRWWRVQPVATTLACFLGLYYGIWFVLDVAFAIFKHQSPDGHDTSTDIHLPTTFHWSIAIALITQLLQTVACFWLWLQLRYRRGFKSCAIHLWCILQIVCIFPKVATLIDFAINFEEYEKVGLYWPFYEDDRTNKGASLLPNM